MLDVEPLGEKYETSAGYWALSVEDNETQLDPIRIPAKFEWPELGAPRYW
jgi:hypothetical protein